MNDDICNKKIEFKTKRKNNENEQEFKKVDKKIWRVLKCKEIIALRDFLYKVCLICTMRLLKFVSADN